MSGESQRNTEPDFGTVGCFLTNDVEYLLSHRKYGGDHQHCDVHHHCLYHHQDVDGLFHHHHHHHHRLCVRKILLTTTITITTIITITITIFIFVLKIMTVVMA